ncbi:MAG: beta-eliminating lyase-related protein [Pararobbsia sp.]
MPRSADERKQLRRNCAHVLYGFAEPKPAQWFAQMARWCEANEVEHDSYGDGALIGDFEAKVADLLGKPAAAFMPSGVMAQLIALRIWTEQRRVERFGLHVTSHLEVHEEQAYQALLGLQGVLVGQRHAPIVADDLKTLAEPLACLLVELPMRELGGQLPPWEALAALKAAARERALPLHMDGARLWESRAFYQRSHAEIAEGFDSVYVSVYKGIGGVAGALLAGEAGFIAQARVWRRRMGGTLVHTEPHDRLRGDALRRTARIAASLP